MQMIDPDKNSLLLLYEDTIPLIAPEMAGQEDIEPVVKAFSKAELDHRYLKNSYQQRQYSA
jgi:hypothetical protein